MKNERISNNQFLVLAIFLVSFSSFCAFLIGYGLNDGNCPVCKDKTIVKVFTTTNNVENEIDYNMITSEIKKDLIGKYVNQLDPNSYFEIYRDGTFQFVRNSCSVYEKFTNDDYVLLMYYAKEEITNNELKLDIDKEEVVEEFGALTEPKVSYKNTFTLIPKKEIETNNVIDSMITFIDQEKTIDGISINLLGPTTCSKSNVYIKEK